MRPPLTLCLLAVLAPGASGVLDAQEDNRQPIPMPMVEPSPASPAGDFSSIRREGDHGVHRSTAGNGPRTMELERRLTRPESAPRIVNAEFYPGSRTLVPYPWNRVDQFPDEDLWRRRDIPKDIQVMSRLGFVPATPVAHDATEIQGVVGRGWGWKAYVMAVPPKGTVAFRLSHSKPAWFRLLLCNRWGSLEEGMLLPAGAPVLASLDRVRTAANLDGSPHPDSVVPARHALLGRSYTNPSDKAKAIYFIVDDPGWRSSKEDPFKVTIERSWDPSAVDLSRVKFMAGIWGSEPMMMAEHRNSGN